MMDCDFYDVCWMLGRMDDHGHVHVRGHGCGSPDHLYRWIGGRQFYYGIGELGRLCRWFDAYHPM